MIEGELKDTTVKNVDHGMSLSVKKTRGTIHSSEGRGGYRETGDKTRSEYHWALSGIAAKIPAGSPKLETEDQQLYDVIIASQGWKLGWHGFKTEADAIKNALEFAQANGIEVDGYSLR